MIEADSGCDQQLARPNGRPQAPCSLTQSGEGNSAEDERPHGRSKS
jgi:hypothetical protein